MLQIEVVAKIEEMKITEKVVEKVVDDDPALEKQKNNAVQNGHDEEITVAS